MGLWNKSEVNLPSSTHHKSQYLLRSSSPHREEESSDDVFHETLDLRTTTTDTNSNEKQSLFNRRDPDALPWSLRAAPYDEDTTNDVEGEELFATTESIDETYQRIMAFQNITLPHECFVAVIDGSLFSGKLCVRVVFTIDVYFE